MLMVIRFNLVSIPFLALLAACVCLLHSPSSFGQNRDATEQRNRYDSLQQDISNLEETLGQYDPALIEVLVSLADAADALNLTSESSSLFDRVIQIHRENFGLFSADQVPFYLTLTGYDATIGDWTAVNNSLNYLYWLLVEKQVVSGESIIDNLLQLSEFHLWAVASDAVEEQPGHYRKAEELTVRALKLSESFWGRFDSRRFDLYYNLIKQLYLQSSAIERGGDTNYKLRAVVPGSSWVLKERVVQSNLHQEGLLLFNEMREIVAAGSDNPTETLAMIDLYRADWHVLFNHDAAEAAYQQAFQKLSDAWIEADELDRLFARPQILPIPVFFDSVGRALSALESSDFSEQNVASVGTGNPLSFQDWFGYMSFVPFPTTFPELSQSLTADYTDIHLSFRMNSLDRVSRWVNGTRRTGAGVVADFEVLSEPDTQAIDLVYLNRRLQVLHFRPRLENGVALPFEGKLFYRAAVPQMPSVRRGR
jgi:tetratricopeptide (TPR) repeat protein